MSQNEIEQNAAAIRQKYSDAFPKTALILGSGLGGFADTLEGSTIISYEEIPTFPQSTVQGHAGRLVIGNAGGVTIACMQGRMHLYEGYEAQRLGISIRTLYSLGVETLIITNAAGGIKQGLTPGGLMVITDHINFSGHNPLIGPNDDSFGVRFPDMTNAYDPGLRAELHQVAKEKSIDLQEGVYLQLTGPSFETPAEIRMLKTLGADAVGMSTVPECIVARHCGMRVAGLSVITNLAAGIADHEITHEDTMENADRALDNFSTMMTEFLRRISAQPSNGANHKNPLSG